MVGYAEFSRFNQQVFFKHLLYFTLEHCLLASVHGYTFCKLASKVLKGLADEESEARTGRGKTRRTCIDCS